MSSQPFPPSFPCTLRGAGGVCERLGLLLCLGRFEIVFQFGFLPRLLFSWTYVDVKKRKHDARLCVCAWARVLVWAVWTVIVVRPYQTSLYVCLFFRGCCLVALTLTCGSARTTQGLPVSNVGCHYDSVVSNNLSCRFVLPAAVAVQ